jgi:hypothetical protein
MFSNRWFFVTFVIILIASPDIHLSSKIVLKPFVALLLILLFAATTGLNWYIFEKVALKNLTAAIAALPQNQKVISLNFINTDGQYKPFFIHAGTYAAIEKNASLNFSFTQFGSSLVQDKKRQPPPWTPALEWYPSMVTASDFKYFNYALINGTNSLHKNIQKQFPIEPVTDTAGWKLYIIKDKK